MAKLSAAAAAAPAATAADAAVAAAASTDKAVGAAAGFAAIISTADTTFNAVKACYFIAVFRCQVFKQKGS